MPYLGNTPTEVPLSSADILDSAITSAKIANGTIALADLSATGTKDATTFLRGDNSFATVSSDVVLLASQDVTSAVASVSFDGYFSSTYDNYRIVFYNYTPASNAQPRLRLRRSNADVTTSSYSFARGLARNAGIDTEVNNTDNLINIDSGNMNNGGSYNLNTIVDLFNPLGTNNFKTGICHQSGYFDSANSIYDAGFTGFTLKDATTAISGITLYFSTGNISRCKAKIYGIK